MTKTLSAEHLAWFNRISQQAADLFEDEAEATHWLNTPKSALDGETPLSALATDAGAKKLNKCCTVLNMGCSASVRLAHLINVCGK